MAQDFADLYFICQRGYKLTELLTFYNKKYGKLASNLVHILKSIVFFSDAEQEEMPNMLKKAAWGEVKTYFENEVAKIKI